jgi:hypothetical protein
MDADEYPFIRDCLRTIIPCPDLGAGRLKCCKTGEAVAPPDVEKIRVGERLFTFLLLEEEA